MRKTQITGLLLLVGGLFLAAYGQGFNPELPFSRLTPADQSKVRQELERAEVQAWKELFAMYACEIDVGVSRKGIETEYLQCFDQDSSSVKDISQTDFKRVFESNSKFLGNLDSSPTNNLVVLVVEPIVGLRPDAASTDAFEAIKEEYVRRVTDMAKATPPVSLDSQSQPAESAAERTEEAGFIEQYGIYLILLLAIIALAGIFFFLKNKTSHTPATAYQSGVNRAGSAQIETLPTNQTDVNLSEMSNLKKKISSKDDKLEKQSEEITRLKGIIENLQQQLRVYKENEISNTTENSAAATESALISTANHRYATYARSDGSFYDADINDDHNSPHYFKLNLQENTGTFTLTDDPNTQLAAADSAGSMLSPVCEYENNPTEAKRGIVTEEEGQLSRNGNHWQVTKKARIRFV